MLARQAGAGGLMRPIDRIYSLLIQAGIDERKVAGELARTCGVSKQAVHAWKRGDITDISAEHIAAIARKYKTSVEYLITGSVYDYLNPLKKEFAGEYVERPFLCECINGAGRAVIAENANAPGARFCRSDLMSIGISENTVFAVRVAGDSMAPVLRDGGLVGITTAQKNIVDGKLYAINWGGILMIRIVYRLPNNKIRLVCYNAQEYPAEICEIGPEIEIIGRVFWYQSEIN